MDDMGNAENNDQVRFEFFFIMLCPIIPGHITALYVFAVINLLALFHITLVEADIIVRNQFNVTLTDYADQPATFGPPFPSSGLWGHVVEASPNDACTKIERAPDDNQTWIAMIKRGGGTNLKPCNFDLKVYHAQLAGFKAAIVHNVNSSQLIPMGASGEHLPINISSCFIGSYDAKIILQNFVMEKFWIIIDDRGPFNPNIYLWPFAIVVGICFVLMLVFMLAKWIRDYRKKKKSRLSKEHLKRLPVKKFRKGDKYDTCAICLDDYEEGEKLRVLPCSHAYHMKCVDPWLTKNKRTCPVCKRKVIPGDSSDSDSESEDDSDAPSESTPLLTTGNASMNSTPRDHFANSGLPAAVRTDVQEMYGSESDSDGDSSLEASGSQCLMAQVHASSPGQRSNHSRSSYGATAMVVNEILPASSPGESASVRSKNSFHSVEDDDDEDGEILDDHFTVDNEMRGLISGGETSDDQEGRDRLQINFLGLNRQSPPQRRILDDDDDYYDDCDDAEQA